jgi:hypothetical protein
VYVSRPSLVRFASWNPPREPLYLPAEQSFISRLTVTDNEAGSDGEMQGPEVSLTILHSDEARRSSLSLPTLVGRVGEGEMERRRRGVTGGRNTQRRDVWDETEKIRFLNFFTAI